MEVKLINRPGETMAEIHLDAHESAYTDGGAMISCSSSLSIESSTYSASQGGVIKAVKRLLASESFFLNHYTATSEGGHLICGGKHSGDMEVLDCDGEASWLIQAGSFVAAESSVGIDVSWRGLKNIFSGESFFWLQSSGKGKIVIHSFGAIFCVNIDGEFTVDTGHIVAFEDHLDFSIKAASRNILNAWASGEGFVCQFEGKGRVWIQSHSALSYGKLLGPLLRPREG